MKKIWALALLASVAVHGLIGLICMQLPQEKLSAKNSETLSIGVTIVANQSTQVRPNGGRLGPNSTLPRDAQNTNTLETSQLPQPEYPRRSQELGEEGTVDVVFSLNSQGLVHVRIVQSSGFPRLDNAALTSARFWDPALVRERLNQAKAEEYPFRFTFQLQKDPTRTR